MHTKDITKTGISRGFLRKCMDEEIGIITPKQEENNYIDPDYRPYDFSQEDLH